MIQPDNAYSKLLTKQEESKADVVLGVFPATQPHKTDMVELDESGRILSFQIKPDRTELIYTWQIAVWTPAFTHFMHDYLSTRAGTNKKETELFVGDVIQAAIKNNMRVESITFNKGTYLDIGTPEDLIMAFRISSKELW